MSAASTTVLFHPSDNACFRNSGCYDTKVTSFRTGFGRLSALAVNGPSSSASVPGSADPPFSWSSVPSNSTLHLGLPTLYDFDFLNTTALELD